MPRSFRAGSEKGAKADETRSVEYGGIDRSLPSVTKRPLCISSCYIRCQEIFTKMQHLFLALSLGSNGTAKRNSAHVPAVSVALLLVHLFEDGQGSRAAMVGAEGEQNIDQADGRHIRVAEGRLYRR